MATKPKTALGTMPCLCCGRDIPVKQAENGTLNAACSWCDFPAYAKVGTEAHQIILGKVTAVNAAIQQAHGPVAKPAATAPAPAIAVEVKRTASPFHFQK